MAAIVAFAALFALSAASGANAAIAIGGVISVKCFFYQMCLANTAYGSCDVVSASAAINGFISGKYDVAFSDVALSPAQDQAAGGTGKLTVPFTVATYTFFTKKASGLRLSTDLVAAIYTSSVSWSSVKAGLSGTVIPVARSDNSGTTEIICRWLSKSSKWPASVKTPCGPTSWSGKGGISKSVVYKSGSGGVGSYLKSTANAIGYIQTGIGAKTYGLNPTAVLNLAGSYVSAVGTADRGDIYSALPRTPKALNLPWNDVALLDVAGPYTYPICAFVYFFAKLNGGSVVKSFATYAVGKAQALASTCGFDPIPSSYQTFGAGWVDRIN